MFFRKKRKPLPEQEIEQTFSFLVNDYGYELAEHSEREEFLAKHFWVYRNNHAERQVEICGNDRLLFVLLRKMINGQPAAYHDKENCTEFISLLALETNNQYDPAEVHPNGPKGLSNALKNISDLLHRHQEILTGKQWVDMAELFRIRDAELAAKFGPFPENNGPVFFDEIIIRATQLLTARGYKRVLNSKELPPFQKNNLPQKLVFEKGEQRISIEQEDWRDDYYIYHIRRNLETVCTINLTEQKGGDAIAQAMAALEEYA